jgi:hypothetical protein
MNEKLVENIRKYLAIVSPFVQVVMLKKTAMEDFELMDTSE